MGDRSAEPAVPEAGIDVDAVAAEVSSKINSRLKAGVYPPEVLARSDTASDLRPLLENLTAAARFTVNPPLTGGRLAVLVKRAMLPGLRWYVSHVVAQQEAFAASVVSAISVTLSRLEELEALAATRSSPARPSRPAGSETRKKA